jgi:hypothetical protein
MLENLGWVGASTPTPNSVVESGSQFPKVLVEGGYLVARNLNDGMRLASNANTDNNMLN